MTSLMEFLAEHDITELKEEISVSKRLPEKFKIRALTQSKFNEIQKRCTSKLTKGGATFDGGKFNTLIIIECCVYPNFSDAEFIKKLGVVAPTEAVSKCLLPGEIATLSQAIQTLSGFDTDINDEIQEAKN